MNLQSGHVTPQFHVIFDDGFTTVPYLNEKVVPPNWAHIFHYHKEQYDAGDFENSTPSGGENISLDASFSEGYLSSIPLSIFNSQVKVLLNGYTFGNGVEQPSSNT